MEKEAEATNAPINLNMEEPKADQTPAAAQLSARLAMQDLEKQRKNIEAKVAGDATKAAAAERLGMGGIARGRVAHSVALGARTIAQADASGRESRRQPEEKKDDEWEVVDTVKWGSSSKNSSSNNGFDDDLWNTSSNPSSKNDFDFEKPAPKPYASTITEKPARSSRQAGGPTHAAAPEVDVQKKFANAKAISSDMYFGSNEMDYETKAALSRFEGQSSLGSADLWGNGQQQQSSSYASQVPEMSDIKDSLRAGASKVAEKFSSLSSSLSSYMSVVRFGERMAAHRNQAAKMRLMLMRDEANGIPVFDRHQLEIPQSLWNQVDNLHDAALIAFRQWHMKRMELLDKMAEVEADLRSLEKGCNVSMVVGSSFGVAGGVAIVAGLAMPPVAVGAQFCLNLIFTYNIFLLFREDNVSISGLIVSGAAAASNFVTSMVKIGVTKKKLRQIEEMLHQDSYNFGSLNEAVVELGKYLELLKDRYPELDNPDVEISSSVFSLLQMGSTGITAAVRSVLLKESAAVSTAFARGAVRSLAVVGVVLDGISIALSSRDLAKGSPSALADKLSMARNELEQHLFENCEAVSMQLGIENPYPQPINDKANDNDIDVGIDIAKDRDNDIAND
ncbi:hypothetical protein WR25_17923 isoform A [Diploscapter pachys]|nr:hypothetical protein WR25_17923 isoform A [Diploscapter pachys]